MISPEGALVPPEYHGREQAYVKHTILKTYLQRLFLIIGQKEFVINYVDCFAGPWADETEELGSTSIGISFEYMKRTQAYLKKTFNRSVKFRALYVEKDKDSYSKLKTYVERNQAGFVDLFSLYGDYVDLIPDILRWAGTEFTFFFVDPKGWKNVAPSILKPLLQRQRSEFLINLMYEFANRSATFSSVGNSFLDVFGDVPNLKEKTPHERENILASKYRKGLNEYYQGRHSHVEVERPGRERTLYFLVYLTRHPLGVAVFKEAAETMVMVQRISHLETRFRKQQAAMPNMDDMFSGSLVRDHVAIDDAPNKLAAREYLLDRLNSGPLIIDHECWADLLEKTDFYPSDFQTAMRDLLREEKVVNLSANATRRRTKIIKPGWGGKAEKWSIRDNVNSHTKS